MSYRVYHKAEDTRLHRFVALKFLPDDVKNAGAESESAKIADANIEEASAREEHKKAAKSA